MITGRWNVILTTGGEMIQLDLNMLLLRSKHILLHIGNIVWLMYFIITVDIYTQLVTLMVDPLMVRERFQVIQLQLSKIYGRLWCVISL